MWRNLKEMNDNELFRLKYHNWKWMKIFSSRKGGDRDEP